MIRILIVDDHPIFRRGVASLIEGEGDMCVAAEVDDGLRAVRLAGQVAWDVALLDISLPRLNGIELLRRFRRTFPERKVLMLSQFPADQFAARVMREGAAAYVSKSGPPEHVIEAVRRAAVGKAGVASPGADSTQARELVPHEKLTPREYQVFTLLADGYSVTRVAAELNVSASTVSNHVASIKEKLGAATIGAIVAYAHRIGLVE